MQLRTGPWREIDDVPAWKQRVLGGARVTWSCEAVTPGGWPVSITESEHGGETRWHVFFRTFRFGAVASVHAPAGVDPREVRARVTAAAAARAPDRGSPAPSDHR